MTIQVHFQRRGRCYSRAWRLWFWTIEFPSGAKEYGMRLLGLELTMRREATHAGKPARVE